MAKSRSKTSHVVLGLDLGTSSCKASLVTPGGHVLAGASAPYTTHAPKPGWAEQNPQDWLTAAGAATQAALKTANQPQIIGIALTCAAHIGVLLDAHDQPLRRAILWSDQRSGVEAQALMKSAGKLILRQTFQAASTSWTLPHFAWLARHQPKALRATRSILLSKDYLLFKLTGEKLTDPGTAVSSQFYNARKNAWSPELCALVGLSPALFPAVAPAGAQAGLLTPAGSEILGIPASIPVFNGTLDSATELLASGVGQPGQGMVRMASAGGLQRVVSKPTANTRRITYPHPITPHWYCQAGTAACATSVGWGMATLAPGHSHDYQAWDHAASLVPAGCQGLLFHPYLAGERAPLWNPGLRASFIGLTTRHTQPHLARAIYEGTAFSIRHAMQAMPVQSTTASPLAAVGGGAKSALWLKILASVLNQPLRTLPDADSSVGAALIGLCALHLTPDLATLTAQRAHLGQTTTPDQAWAAQYDKQFRVYASLSRALVACCQ